MTKLGIIGAMEEEVETLLAQMEDKTSETVAGSIFYEGKLSSLKRFKDDAKEVNQGYECGLGNENYNDVKDGDIIESRFAVTRRNRTIHARMREYLYELKHHPQLETVILPVGDGITLSVKKTEEV